MNIMGRIKDLVIELQNEYGYDLEFLPEEFSIQEYLEMKSKEPELFCQIAKKTKSL
jgi:hypothetical protein